MAAQGGDGLFELKLIFLRELEANYQKAREGYDAILRRPGDRAPLGEVRGFFHRIAGTAESIGLPLLGKLAGICETVCDLALEGRLDDPRRLIEVIADGLAGVAVVLDEHGERGDRAIGSATVQPMLPIAQPSLVAGEPVLSKVLVVDDDVFSAKMIDSCLSNAGLVSTCCSNPDEALELVQRELPDLIILDVQMPGIDGFDLCRRLRALPAMQFTPIIFVTRKGDVEQRIRGLEVGGNDYIAKPFEPGELVARVRSHLTRLAAMRDLTIRDGLTRCFNHNYLKLRLGDEIARARRYQAGLVAAMIDIDHFKKINDTHGHQAGDAVLADLASVLQASVRSTDVVARYGGEEFSIVFVEANATEAEIISNRICERIASKEFVTSTLGSSEPRRIGVTISIGLAEFQLGDQVESLLRRADRALYAAKSQGRNRVVRAA